MAEFILDVHNSVGQVGLVRVRTLPNVPVRDTMQNA